MSARPQEQQVHDPQSADDGVDPLSAIGAELASEPLHESLSESITATVWPITPSGLLLPRWERAWDELSGLPRTGLFETTISRYTAPARHYHNVQHLGECFEVFDRLSHHCDHPAEVELAIWFHDAVYDVNRRDSEVVSADLAFNTLSKSGVELLSAERVRKLVLATQHRHPPQTVDEGVLLDVDLAILGAPADRFWEYEAQVRREYASLSDEVYANGRIRLLELLLSRVRQGGFLYRTPEMRAEVEPQARENLAESLRRLQSGELPPRMPWGDGEEDPAPRLP